MEYFSKLKKTTDIIRSIKIKGILLIEVYYKYHRVAQRTDSYFRENIPAYRFYLLAKGNATILLKGEKYNEKNNYKKIFYGKQLYTFL